MPVEVAAPVALLSLAPAGGKMALPAMPALFKAGIASGAAGKAAGASSFAGVKGGIGAGKGLAAKGSFMTKEAGKHTEHVAAKGSESVAKSGEEEGGKEMVSLLFGLLGGGKPSDILNKERQKSAKPRRVALSRRGDRSKMYGEFL